MDYIIIVLVTCFLFLAVSVAIIFGFCWVFDTWKKKRKLKRDLWREKVLMKERETVLMKVRETVRLHVQALHPIWEQLMVVDGKVPAVDASSWSSWNKEVAIFCQKIVAPALGWSCFPTDYRPDNIHFPISEIDVSLEIINEIYTYRRELEKSKRTELLVKVRQTVRLHAQALSTKSEQLRIVDEYGTVDDSSWNKEMGYFCQKVVAPALGWWSGFPADNRPENIHFQFPITQLDVEIIVSEEIQSYKREHQAISKSVSNLSPVEFEHHCADVLRNNGWNARTTKRTGDQGIDVLATKNNRKVVLQCKYYSNPVGNKAVQECYAAKDFSRADFAVVVTNSRFTLSAKQLAGSLGVLLMHHSELDHLDARLATKK